MENKSPDAPIVEETSMLIQALPGIEIHVDDRHIALCKGFDHQGLY